MVSGRLVTMEKEGSRTDTEFRKFEGGVRVHVYYVSIPTRPGLAAALVAASSVYQKGCGRYVRGVRTVLKEAPEKEAYGQK